MYCTVDKATKRTYARVRMSKYFGDFYYTKTFHLAIEQGCCSQILYMYKNDINNNNNGEKNPPKTKQTNPPPPTFKTKRHNPLIG